MESMTEFFRIVGYVIIFHCSGMMIFAVFAGFYQRGKGLLSNEKDALIKMCILWPLVLLFIICTTIFELASSFSGLFVKK